MVKIYNGFATVRKTTKLIEALVSAVLRTIVLLRFFYVFLPCFARFLELWSQCSTVGDRAFAVAGARLWNSLPHDIVASDTLSQFRRELKAFLFRQSYPCILLLVLYLVVLAVFSRPY